MSGGGRTSVPSGGRVGDQRPDDEPYAAGDPARHSAFWEFAAHSGGPGC